MKYTIKNPIVFTALLLWFGVFMTVSFVETPLKFQVPGVTLPVALELGKIMFGFSTHFQMAMLAIVAVGFLLGKKRWNWFSIIAYTVIIATLLLQKFWMLPVLDARADLLAAGKSIPPTVLHDYFIYSEVVKAIFLVIVICFQLVRTKNNHSVNSLITL